MKRKIILLLNSIYLGDTGYFKYGIPDFMEHFPSIESIKLTLERELYNKEVCFLHVI